MVVIIYGKYENDRYRADTIYEVKDLEYIGQGQRSSHATHLLMLVIICTKYEKNPSRTVYVTEQTRFLRPRPNSLEDIGQGQRSLYGTHLLLLVIICAEYGKNPWRTTFFFKVKVEKCQKFIRIQMSGSRKKNVTRDTPSNDCDHLLSTVIIWSFVFNIKIIHPELWTLQSGHDDFLSQGRMTLKVYVKVKGHHMRQTSLMLLIICTKFGKNPSWIVDVTGRTRKVNGQTDRQTDRQGESNIPP